MQTRRTSINALLVFTQLLDSAFPSGAFIHSFGLEAHILLGKITKAEALENYLKNLLLDSYKTLIFPTIEAVYRCAEIENLSRILRIDALFSAFFTAPYAKANGAIGKNYLDRIDKTRLKICTDYFDAARGAKTPCNAPIILSVFAFDLGLEAETFMALYAKKNLIAFALASQKIARIKPSEAQAALFAIDETLIDCIKNRAKTPYSFNPLFDAAAFAHKTLEPRLFAT
jgi:urease accessory protein